MKTIDEVGLKEKLEDIRYIKIRPEAKGVRENDLTCHYCELQNRKWADSLEGWYPYPGTPPTMQLLTVGRPQSKDSPFCWEDHL